MPPQSRRARPSLTPQGADDTSTLSLREVQSRLERNERVLKSSLFSPSLSTLPPRLSQTPTSPTPDPVREKLLASRQQLLQREQELILAESVGNMDVNPAGETSEAGRRRSSVGGRSGKARAMEMILAAEGRLPRTTIILPMAETLALGQRDFEQATAQTLANMSLNQHPPSTFPGKHRPVTKGDPFHDPGGNDEISRAQAAARMRAFMSYKGEDEDLLDDDEWGEGEYDGDGDRMVLEPRGGGVKRERGTGEEVDEQGEDDEGWNEGNDEYYDRTQAG